MGYEDPGSWKQKNKIGLSTDKPGSFATEAISGMKSAVSEVKNPTSDAFNKRMGETVTKAMDPTQGLSLGYEPFAKESISSMKSAVSDASKPTSSYSQAEQRWKDAGSTSIISKERKGWQKSESSPKESYTKYEQEGRKKGKGYAYTTTSSEAEAFKKSGETPKQGPGVVPSSGIFKTEKGNIIENIPGESGKTRDKAIIHRKPSGDTSKSTVKKDVFGKQAEEYTSEGVYTGLGHQKGAAKYDAIATQDAMKNKKPTFRERREAKKEAKWKGKVEKGLQKAIKQRENYKGSGKSSNTPFVYDPS